MNRQTLDLICEDIDKNISNGKFVGARKTITQYNVPFEEYVTFHDQYSRLAEAYHQEKKQLEKIAATPNIRLGRIGWNTLMGAAIGSIYEPKAYTVPGGAIVGSALTLYDEYKKRGLDLEVPFWSTLVGGVIGSIIDHQNINSYTQIGAAIGGALGLAKEFYATRGKVVKKTETRRTLQELNDSHNKRKEHLIANSLPKEDK